MTITARAPIAHATPPRPAPAPSLRSPLLWLGPVVFMLTMIQQEIEPVPWPAFLVLLGAAFMLGSLLSIHALSSREKLWTILILGISIVVAAAPVIFEPDARSPYQLARRFAPLLGTWTLLLLLVSQCRATDVHDSPRNDIDRKWLVALLSAAFALLTVSHALTVGRYTAIIDETLYVLQSHLLGQPGFVRHIDGTLEPFFTLKQTVLQDGRLYPEYTPGWPALLAAFDLVGLRWWAPVVVSTLGVFFTYLLGRDVHSTRAGLLAAALLASNQVFVILGSGYFAHGATLTVAVAAAWLLVAGERASHPRRLLYTCVAGSLLGFTVTLRPLTGATLTISVVGLLLLRRIYHRRELSFLLAALAVGALPPILALLTYNVVTTGGPFLFGYQAANGGLHELGFGMKGWMLPDSLGRMVPSTKPFTPLIAFEHLLGRIYEFSIRALPAFLTGIVVFLGLRTDYRFRWRMLIPFLALPAAYFFYYYTSIRFYVELFPYFYVAIAALIVHAARHNRRLIRLVVGSAIAAQLLLTGVNIHRNWSGREENLFPLFRAVEATQQANGRVLLFVEAPGVKQELLESLAWFNAGEFPGEVVVARDLGAANHRLMNRLPTYVPFRASRVKGRLILTPVPR